MLEKEKVLENELKNKKKMQDQIESLKEKIS